MELELNFNLGRNGTQILNILLVIYRANIDKVDYYHYDCGEQRIVSANERV